ALAADAGQCDISSSSDREECPRPFCENSRQSPSRCNFAQRRVAEFRHRCHAGCIEQVTPVLSAVGTIEPAIVRVNNSRVDVRSASSLSVVADAMRERVTRIKSETLAQSALDLHQHTGIALRTAVVEHVDRSIELPFDWSLQDEWSSLLDI